MLLTRRTGAVDVRRVVYLPVERIRINPENPRRSYDPKELKELATSIRRYGVVQPLNVRKYGDGWEVVSGERRLRASKLAGLTEVPCIVLDVNSAESSIVALIENIQRKELDFIEEAEGIFRLIVQYGYSQEEAARKLGYTQSTVANKLRILRLPKTLLRTMREAGLSERHARALLRLEDNTEREKALREIISGRLNVAQTEEYIDRQINGEDPKLEPSQSYIIKDVRLFLNTLERGVNMLRSGGVDVSFVKEQADSELTLKIVIPGVSQWTL